MAPPRRASVAYEIRPRSPRPGEPMAEIWIDGAFVWLIHRKVASDSQVDPPDPKTWIDPATAIKYVLRHDDGFYCDDCPSNKTGQVPAPPKQYCPPHERRFSIG